MLVFSCFFCLQALRWLFTLSGISSVLWHHPREKCFLCDSNKYVCFFFFMCFFLFSVPLIFQFSRNRIAGPVRIRQTEKPVQGWGKGNGRSVAILPSVGHLQLITTLKIAADCCQLCQYRLTKPKIT